MQLRHGKWSVWILTSILLLGNMGLSPDAFADDDKLANITILYEPTPPLSPTPEVVDVTDKNGNPIVSESLTDVADTILIEKSDFGNNKFTKEIFFTAQGTGITAKLKTSCHETLFIGKTFGDYVVIDLTTNDGNDFCGDDHDDDDKEPSKRKNKVLTGEGPPPDKLGKIGDLYFDSLTEIISHVKISKFEWEPRGVVGGGASGTTGPQGPAGATGPQGPAGGPQGPAGATGPQGPAGATGPQGPAGATGPPGADGAAGTDGMQGADGAAGTDGVQGIQGVSGPAGSDGAQGVSGTQGVQGIQGVILSLV